MLKQLLTRIRDYFGASVSEARGFLVLMVISVLALAAPWLYRYVAPDQQPADTSVADARKLDSLLSQMQDDERSDQRSNFQRYTERSDDDNATFAMEPKLFRFDPNRVSVAEWQQLGLPAWLAKRIDKYRSKGGQFRKKEDLLRIYDFPPALYAQLEPYIMLGAEGRGQGIAGTSGGGDVATEDRANATAPHGEASPGRYAGAGPSADRFPARPTYEKPAPVQSFDINTADTSALIRLRGIGAVRARQILKFRDALGGFASTAQYATIYNLDSVAVDELNHYARIQTPARKLNVNTATADELDRHPYLSRRQADLIVRYREQHGLYQNAEALRPLRLLDAATLARLEPYLAF